MNEKKILAYALENSLRYEKAAANSVLNALFNEGLKKQEIPEVMPKIKESVDKVNKMSRVERETEFAHLLDYVKKREVKVGLPDLPSIKGKDIVMRYAPYPSGPLHIGNARQAVLNDEYAKKYNGKLILVMDDTIGSEEKALLKEAYKLIPDGLDWLNVDYSKPVYFKSERLEIYYKYAEELIKKGYAYVCSCSAEELRKNRLEMKECGCRQFPLKDHLARWKDMFKSKQGDYVLRIKTSMQDKNPAFRDRVLFRISEREHPKTKKKYRVWPLLEFSWAIDDHLLGITHIIRGKELEIESQMEEFIWKIFNWPKLEIIHTGLLKIEGVKISKSKGQKEVKEGRYVGWDDPRLWSLQSLEKRGIKPEALRKFIINLGLSKSETTVPIDILYSENRKLIEKSKRYFFIENPTKIKIKGFDRARVELPLHPSLKLGKRIFNVKNEFVISQKDKERKEEYFRLMHLLNFSRDLKFISKELDKTLKASPIHWLPVDSTNMKKLVQVSVRMPDGSLSVGLGEEDLKTLKQGEIIQFERFGFCRFNGKAKNKFYEFWFAHG